MTPAFRELLARVPEVRTLYDRLPEHAKARVPYDQEASCKQAWKAPAALAFAVATTFGRQGLTHGAA
jgi:hypothetical protein